MQKKFVNRLYLVLHACVEIFDVIFFMFTEFMGCDKQGLDHLQRSPRARQSGKWTIEDSPLDHLSRQLANLRSTPIDRFPAEFGGEIKDASHRVADVTLRKRRKEQVVLPSCVALRYEWRKQSWALSHCTFAVLAASWKRWVARFVKDSEWKDTKLKCLTLTVAYNIVNVYFGSKDQRHWKPGA